MEPKTGADGLQVGICGEAMHPRCSTAQLRGQIWVGICVSARKLTGMSTSSCHCRADSSVSLPLPSTESLPKTCTEAWAAVTNMHLLHWQWHVCTGRHGIKV